MEIEVVCELRNDLEGRVGLSVLIEVLISHYHLTGLFGSEVWLDVVLQLLEMFLVEEGVDCKHFNFNLDDVASIEARSHYFWILDHLFIQILKMKSVG